MSSNSRQGCAERIKICENGFIPQVKMTSCGLNQGALAADGDYPAVIACNLTDGKMPHIGNGVCRQKKPHITHKKEERFITQIQDHTLIGYKYFCFEGKTKIFVMTSGTGSGKFLVCNRPGEMLGEIMIRPSKKWIENETVIDAEGTHALYFIFKGKGTVEFLRFGFAKES